MAETNFDKQAQQLRGLQKKSVADAIACGRLLDYVGTRLPHGEFMNWLEKSCDLPYRTAHRFRKLYQFSEVANLANLNLSLSAAHTLAEAKTPDEVRDQLLKRARKSFVRHSDVKQAIADYSATAEATEDANSEEDDGDDSEAPDQSSIERLRAALRTVHDAATSEFPAARWPVGSINADDLRRVRNFVDELMRELTSFDEKREAILEKADAAEARSRQMH